MAARKHTLPREPAPTANETPAFYFCMTQGRLNRAIFRSAEKPMV